jgi:hypothetical protein
MGPGKEPLMKGPKQGLDKKLGSGRIGIGDTEHWHWQSGLMGNEKLPYDACFSKLVLIKLVEQDPRSMPQR